MLLSEVFTPEEVAAKSINEERLYEIINSEGTVITRCTVSKNDSGEFLFIAVRWNRIPAFFLQCSGCGRFHVGPYPGVNFFGMGFDEKEGRFFETEWRFYGATSFSINTRFYIKPDIARQEIEKRRPINQI